MQIRERHYFYIHELEKNQLFWCLSIDGRDWDSKIYAEVFEGLRYLCGLANTSIVIATWQLVGSLHWFNIISFSWKCTVRLLFMESKDD